MHPERTRNGEACVWDGNTTKGDLWHPLLAHNYEKNQRASSDHCGSSSGRNSVCPLSLTYHKFSKLVIKLAFFGHRCVVLLKHVNPSSSLDAMANNFGVARARTEATKPPFSRHFEWRTILLKGPSVEVGLWLPRECIVNRSTQESANEWTFEKPQSRLRLCQRKTMEGRVRAVNDPLTNRLQNGVYLELLTRFSCPLSKDSWTRYPSCWSVLKWETKYKPAKC